MLKEYSIQNILEVSTSHIPYYAGTFEGTDDPDLEWPHRHAFYSLVWFTQGKGFYVIDFQEYEIKTNRIFFVNPKQIHNWDYSEDTLGYILVCDPSLGTELNLEQTSPYVDLVDNKPFFEHIFNNLIEECEFKDNLSVANIPVTISYLYAQLRRITYSDEANHHPSVNPSMDRFKQLIVEEANLTKVKDYADRLQLSEENLSSICKEFTGVSAKQLILDLKTTEAKRLLIYSNLNVNEISYRLGFEDSSYFSRIFKRKLI